MPRDANDRASCNLKPRLLTGMRTSRLVVVAGSVLVLVLVVGCLFGLWRLRVETLADSRGDLDRLALALTEQTERAFQSIDLVIEQTRSEINHLGPAGLADGATLHQVLKTKIFGLPQGQALLVFGADGTMIAHSREFPTPRVIAADRDYFASQRSMATDRLFISRPLRNRVNNRWMVSLSRHFQAPATGGFGGVVMAAIEVEYFARLYHALNLPDGVSIVLQRLDGVALVEHPGDATAEPASALGAISGTVPERVPQGGGRPVLMAIGTVPDYNLAVGLMLPEAAALTPWRRLALGIGAGTATAVLALLAFTALLARQVTKLEQRERARAHLAAIVGTSADAIIGIDLDGRITSWNHGADATFGYDAAGAIGRPLVVLAPDERAAEVAALIEQVLSGRTISHYETVLRRRDGSPIEVSLTVSPIRDERGACIGGSAIARDITERRQAEARMAGLMEEQRAILQSEVVGIVMLRKRAMVWMNRAYAGMLGYDVDDLMNRPTRIFYRDDETYLEFRRRAYPVITAGKVFRTQIQYLRKDGSMGWFDVSGAELHSGGDDSIWAFVDISAQKLTEARLIEAQKEAHEANLAKSQFLAMMSHEIRTPITSVLGMADLLHQTPLTDEQAGYVNTLGSSTKTLLTILNDILDISKLEAGKVAIEATAFPLRDAVQDAVDLGRAGASAKGLVLELDIADEVPRTVIGDPTRLKQALFNLLSNAIKFTERGFVRVRLSVARRRGNAAVVLTTIEDTGIGLDREQIGRLFTVFAQADQSTTRRFGGTGLGLAITRKLVELMGGEIGVDSAPDQGAKFWFTLPFEVAADADGRASAGYPAPRPPDRPKRALRILLAEDNRINQMLVRSMLMKLGHSVEVADNGRLAVEMVVAGDFDAVLMDMQMPEMDGEEATRRIRALPPPKNRLPVLALTADVMAEHQERYHRAGIDALVPKPIDWQVLSDALALHDTAGCAIIPSAASAAERAGGVE